MFQLARKFNQPIGNWNTSNAFQLTSMFSGANIFNQDIGNWNVSNVQVAQEMFVNATAFNNGGSATIATWNVANVILVTSMFVNAQSFTQNLSSWITGLTTQPTSFSANANPTFANNANLRKPFLSGGGLRIIT
jgi:hypothetical protein